MSKLKKSIADFINKHKDRSCPQCGGGVLLHAWFAEDGKIKRSCVFKPNGGGIREIHRRWLNACILEAVERDQINKNDTFVTKSTHFDRMREAVDTAVAKLNDLWDSKILKHEQEVRENSEKLEAKIQSLESETEYLMNQRREDATALASEHNKEMNQLKAERALETADYEKQLAELRAEIDRLSKKSQPSSPTKTPPEQESFQDDEISGPAPQLEMPLSNLTSRIVREPIKLPGVHMVQPTKPASEPVLVSPQTSPQEIPCDACNKKAQFSSEILFEDGTSKTVYSCSKGKTHLNKAFNQNLDGKKTAKGFSFKSFYKNKLRIQGDKHAR